MIFRLGGNIPLLNLMLLLQLAANAVRSKVRIAR